MQFKGFFDYVIINIEMINIKYDEINLVLNVYFKMCFYWQNYKENILFIYNILNIFIMMFLYCLYI